jgi:SAM-dependent methyltransferase
MFDETRPTSIHGEQEKIEKPDYEDYFINCYGEVTHEIRDIVPDQGQVLDLGCGRGSAERKIETMKRGCFVTCVDSDRKSIAEMFDLKEKLSESDRGNELDIVLSDANIFLQETNLVGQDTVLVVAVLHEINDIEHRREYLTTLLERLSRVTKPGSKVLIADYYYDDSVSDEEVEQFKEYQLEAIGHADAREKFVKPEEIIEAVEGSDFTIPKPHKQMLAVEGIKRYFYLLTLERKVIDAK